MAVIPVKVPKKLADFIGDKSAADMQRIEDLLNALQNLKVQVNIDGTTRTATATIQISGDAAVIVVML